jgi:hypothetical protein
MPKAAPIPELFSTSGIMVPAEKDDKFEIAYTNENAKLNS